MRLTRRSFLGGAAAAAVGGAGIYELVDQLTRCAAPHAPRPRCRRSSTSSTSARSRARASRCSSRRCTARSSRRRSTTTICARRSAISSRRCSGSTRARAGRDRARRHRRLGPAVLRAARRRAGEDAPAVRPSRRQARAAARPPLPERPARHGPRGERRRRSAPQRQPASTSTTRTRRSSTTSTSSRVTSIRRGFAGGGFDGKQSLPKKMAMAAGVPGADLIPDTSELFLGFTSTQKAGLGPRLIANHETLGYVDLRGGYFHGGTHMHLSHISEDLEAWYLNFDFDERVLTSFRPGLTEVKQGAQTVPQGPKDIVDARSRSTHGYNADRPLRAQRVDPDDLAARAGHRRARRHGLPEGHRDPAARGLQHARQPVRVLVDSRSATSGAASRRQACTSSSSTRPATTSSATGSRWTASARRHEARRRRRAAARRASTRC